MKIYVTLFSAVYSRILTGVVEPEVIIPQEVINIPEYYEKDIELGCAGQPHLPTGGRFSSPGWEEQYVYANNMNCTWILGRSGCTTEIDFYEIDIEDLHLLRKCPYDKLTLRTYDHQLYKELCGRSPPEIFRVFGPIEVNFNSDKTVQRRGWTAAVNVYNCNYPHLEDKSWQAKEKKHKKEKNIITTLPVVPTVTTTTTTIATTTTMPFIAPLPTTVLTTKPKTAKPMTTVPITVTSLPSSIVTTSTEIYTTTVPFIATTVATTTTDLPISNYPTTSSTTLAVSDKVIEDNVEYSRSMHKKLEESFDQLEDRLSVTLNRLQSWARNITDDRQIIRPIDVQILETSATDFNKDSTDIIKHFDKEETSGVFEGSSEVLVITSPKEKSETKSKMDKEPISSEAEFNSVDYNPTDYLADVYLQFRGDMVST